MKRLILCTLIGATVVGVTACKDDKTPFNLSPDFLLGEVRHSQYNGVTNDLLTGGLGASGPSTTPPGPHTGLGA